MTFGVPIQGLPITGDGEMKTAAHLKWYQRRTAKEAFLRKHNTTSTTPVEFPGIDIPARMDVLLGRGKPFREYPGNRRLLEVVEAFSQEYATAVTGEKSRVADWIVTVVQTSGGCGGGGGTATQGARFLKQDADNGWWVPVENDIAREKVCAALRKTRNHATQRIMTMSMRTSNDTSASNGTSATGTSTAGISASTTKFTSDGGSVMQQQGVKRVKF
jgi:hypothetical protein